jgi:hypothetical protein
LILKYLNSKLQLFDLENQRQKSLIYLCYL